MNTSISRCLKEEFKAYEKISDNKYMLAWGLEGEVERVTTLNEETQEIEFTDKNIETEYCTYESGIFQGNLTIYNLNKVFETSTRQPGLIELCEIYDGIGVNKDDQISLLKNQLKNMINLYDKSSHVEDFTIQGVHLWLDSTMRAKVRENLETAQFKKEENVILRYEGMEFPLTTELGWILYYAVLDYARETWNTTQTHLANVDKLTSMDDILNYDYKSGYPSKLSF